MQAVILAGGAGTRLRPFTLDTPKPMIDINGKPFLYYIIKELSRYGIKDYVFCVGYLADKFKEYFGDGSGMGIRIVYSIENEFVGTGGALKIAESKLEDDFIAVNGDTYLPIDYSEVYERFKLSDKSGLIVVYDNKERIAEPNIALDEKGDVIAYNKKETLKMGDRTIKNRARPNISCDYVDAGVQVFKKSVLDLIPSGKFVSLEVDIFPKLISKKELAAFVSSQRYFDLGTPERLEYIRGMLK